MRQYLDRCVAELGCSVEVPNGGGGDYLNVYPPPRCRRARVAGVTYSSSRTAVFAGAMPLDGYERAEQTIDGGSYKYPKRPHLDDQVAVDEAITLTSIAIERLER